MANLIITIIAIALVAVASLMGAYYGGRAFLDARLRAQASTLVAQGQQISGAFESFIATYSRNPVGIGELYFDPPNSDEPFLDEWPQPPTDTVDSGEEWFLTNANALDANLANQDVAYDTSLGTLNYVLMLQLGTGTQKHCEHINQSAGLGDSAIKIAANAITSSEVSATYGCVEIDDSDPGTTDFWVVYRI